LHPLTDEMMVRTTLSRAPELLPSGKAGVLVFRASGREWNLPQALATLLADLADGLPRSVKSLRQHVVGDFPDELATSILSEFLAQGLLEVVNPEIA